MKRYTTWIIIYLLTLFIAFRIGTIVGVKKNIGIFIDAADNIALSTHLSEAATLHHILQAHREGNSERVTDILESRIDLSLLAAEPYVDADPEQAIATLGTDWQDLKLDREKHPRRKTTPEKDVDINRVLDKLIKMRP